ncbi:MAG: hypothetical protein KME29_05010 [Calothrix sp. FI2-JRJ7]|jgi:hypothetical protein|nr:hypothetical protein [Calothrix sp. FI2-JRJ7]
MSTTPENQMYKIELTGDELQELLFAIDNINLEGVYQFCRNSDELQPILTGAIKKLWKVAIENKLLSPEVAPDLG